MKDIIFGNKPYKLNNITHPILYLPHGISLTVLRLKLAKAIVKQCNTIDNSAPIAADGLSMHGHIISIHALLQPSPTYGFEYSITIISKDFDRPALVSLVEAAFTSIDKFGSMTDFK